MPDIIPLLDLFAPLFSSRVWSHAQVLLIGAMLSPGVRTVTAILRAMGLAAEAHFTNYHRVLNRAVWYPLQGSRLLLGLLVAAFVPSDGPLILGGDDTIERRQGKRIKAKGCYRDPIRSTKKYTVRCFGLKWVSLMLLVPVPWSERVWALPFLTALCPSAEVCRKEGRRHKTSHDWLRQMVKQVRRWWPHRQMVLIVDGAFASVGLGWACVGCETVLVSRLRWDARLYHPPGPQPKGKRGPKPQKGQRQRRLKEWAARGDTPWQEEEIGWYGGQKKRLWLFSRTALWYRAGQSPLPIRFVLVRDPEGKLRDEVFFCTDLQAASVQILEWVIMRWGVEVTFEEARAHLGMETQRQWSDQAILRTTPCLLGLFSIVTWLTHHLQQHNQIPVQTTAWYRKIQPTFSDCLYWVRQHIWNQQFFVHSTSKRHLIQLPHELIDLLGLYGLPKAA
jgi:hypothetical protein